MENSFHFSTSLNDFIFKGFSVSSIAGIIGIGILTGFIPILSDFVHLMRECLEKKRSSWINFKSVTSEVAHLRTGQVPVSYLNRSVYLTIQSTLYMLELLCYYIIMLSLSTYNAWLFLSLLTGATLSYFVLEPILQRQKEHKDPQNLLTSTNFSESRVGRIRDRMFTDSSVEELLPETHIATVSTGLCH